MIESPVTAKRKVLVVEDNAVNREILCALLEDSFEVLQAENGLVGLDQLAQHYKDLSLIVLDIHMPECDGMEFLRRKAADERYAPVPVVVATASDSTEDELTCLELGATDFVVKPYNFEIITNRISNLIALRESASIVNQLMWDDTTGLNSKEFFVRGVEDALAAHPGERFDMVVSDIERFRSLNDRYGTARCDQILRDLARGLRETLPGVVEGGRIGGDVFAFLIRHQEDDLSERLQAMVAGIDPGNLSVKFGVVADMDRAVPVPLTYDRALLAAEELKGMLGVAVGYFDDELQRRQRLEQTIVDSAEGALLRHEFLVYFQPKHDVRTGRVGGAEALVRWEHPELGHLAPDTFIGLFERNGFITKLDLYIWEEACREIKRCQELGLPVVPISINASALDFDVRNLPERIKDIADRHGIDYGLLHIELTETAYSDNPEIVTHTLAEMRELGFKVELDDFGSGYSSLASLNTLPLNVMKLDMSVLRQAVKLDDFRIVESCIQLSKLLGLQSVVEGVETAEEAMIIKALGGDIIQGFYYSRPLPQEQFEEYLRKDR